MSRKTKLTPEMHKQIIDHIKVGNTVTAVVDVVGISKDAYYEWIKRGMKDRQRGSKTIYSDFADDVERAPAFAEVFHVQNIFKASKTNPYFSKWWLEHKRSAEYSAQATLNVLVNDVELIAKLASSAEAVPLSVPNLDAYVSADTVPPMIEAPKSDIEDAEIIDDDEFAEPEPLAQIDMVQPKGETEHEEIKPKSTMSNINFTL
jgi:hypothetical protein